MSWLAWTAVIVLALFGLYVFFVIAGLLRRNTRLTDQQKEDLQRQLDIESGVIRNNAKADRLLDNPDYKRRLYDEDNR